MGSYRKNVFVCDRRKCFIHSLHREWVVAVGGGGTVGFFPEYKVYFIFVVRGTADFMTLEKTSDYTSDYETRSEL